MILWVKHGDGIYISKDHRFVIERQDATRFTRLHWRALDLLKQERVDRDSLGDSKAWCEEVVRVEGETQ